MIYIRGKKQIEIDHFKIKELLGGSEKCIVDLGTGDGRFVFENAKSNPENFYIGIDPVAKQLEIYSKKINRKRLKNALLLIGSLETIPLEMQNIADLIYINLPWGTLLQTVVIPTMESFVNIQSMLKPGGKLELIIGYNIEAEPSEVERLKLPELDQNYIDEFLVPMYKRHGFKLISSKELNQDDLKNTQTTWSKKLSFGNPRNIFKLNFSFAEK